MATSPASYSPKEFKKREGTTDQGKLFELRVTAELLLQLISDEEVAHFELTSNDKDFGDFDDVVIDLKNERYAFQLKHKDSKQLSLESLSSEKGNFSVNKYFRSYQKVEALRDYNLGLVTNQKFTLTGKVSMEVKLDGEVCNVEIKKSGRRLIPGECYQLEVVGGNPPGGFEEFLKRFYLYPNHPSADLLKMQLLQDLEEKYPGHHHEELLLKYLNFIEVWSSRSKNVVLYKEMVTRRIALWLLEDHILPVSFGDVNDNQKVLQKVINNFHASVFKVESPEQLQRVFGDAGSHLHSREALIAEKNYQISPGEKSQLLWVINKCPLLLRANPQVYKPMEMCRNSKFILLMEDPSTEDLPPGFYKLSDLPPEDLEVVATNFQVSLPGATIILKQLYDQETNFLSTTTSELLSMIHPYVVQQPLEDIKLPYITRHLSRTIIDFTFLETINSDTIVVISNVEDTSKLKKSSNLMSVDDFLHGEQQRAVLITEGVCTLENFQKITERKKCHHLRFFDGVLEWVQSTDDISDLQSYRVSGHFLKEEDLWTTLSDNKIHVISGDPGLGKSWLLKNLKNTFSGRVLTVIFSPKDMYDFLREKPVRRNLDDFVVKIKFSKAPPFDQEVFKLLIRTNQVVFFWDALDEIAFEETELITDLIKEFSEDGVVQIVTCRRHLKNFLENKFNVCSRTIAEFDEHQRVSYIHQRLQDVCEDLEDVTEKITKNVAFTKHRDILNIPLQIYMLTELRLQNSQKFSKLLGEVFAVTDLYQYFVEEKFNFYYKKLQVDNFGIQQVRRTLNDFIPKWQKASLKTILESNVFEQLNINCDDILRQTKLEGDCFGILTQVVESGTGVFFEFAHISYAEYFAALFFFQQKSDHLVEILFEARYTNVRFFYDMLLAKNCNSHIAVLSKNLSEVKTTQVTDSGGRNLLQLACSWGQRYPILDVVSTNQTFIIDLKEEVPSLDHLHQEFVDTLLDDFNPADMDDFRMTAVEYAEKSDNLFALALIEKKLNNNYFNSKDDKFNCSLLYYSVRLGEEDFITMFEKYVKRVRVGDEQTLLHLAAELGHHRVVEKLVEFGLDVDACDRYKQTALLLATKNDHQEVVKTLIGLGAELDGADIYSWSPLLIASSDGREEIAMVLVEAGAKVNVTNKEGLTPLLFALSNHLDSLALLLINHHADVNPKNRYGTTPLLFACADKRDTIAIALIQAHASVNVKDKENLTPLLFACANSSIEVSKLLIEHGAQVNVKNRQGLTPLFFACENDCEEVAVMLIEHQAEVDVQNERGRTALFFACERGQVRVVEALLNAGAEVDVISKDDYTALEVAERYNHKEVVEVLKRRGAKVRKGKGCERCEELREENERLKKEVERLREEVERLKKL